MPEQADGVGLPIDDQGEQVEDVATQHAHIEGFRVGESGKLPTEDRFADFIVGEADASLDNDRLDSSSDAAQSIWAVDGSKMKCIRYLGAEDGAVGTCIYEKGGNHPRPISGLKLAPNDGPHHAVIAKIP